MLKILEPLHRLPGEVVESLSQEVSTKQLRPPSIQNDTSVYLVFRQDR